MFKFGPDFNAARAGVTYTAVSGQWWLWAVLFAALQMLVLLLVQNIISVAVYLALFGGLSDFANADAGVIAKISKAFVLGMFPSACLTALFVWWSAGWLNRTGERGIPLHGLNVGIGGWAVTIVGVMLALYGVNALTFNILGIDPKTYMPTSDGVNDVTSAAGMVEKIIADLADEPWLMAVALPGIIFGAPMSEELIFRGALFASLRGTWVGQSGAVVLSAAAWALVHGFSAPWLFVFLIFIMGLFLGWLLLRFGSLWVTIAAHAAWNAFSSLAIFGGVTGS
jgi:uncharacterized protein